MECSPVASQLSPWACCELRGNSISICWIASDSIARTDKYSELSPLTLTLRLGQLSYELLDIRLKLRNGISVNKTFIEMNSHWMATVLLVKTYCSVVRESSTSSTINTRLPRRIFESPPLHEVWSKRLTAEYDKRNATRAAENLAGGEKDRGKEDVQPLCTNNLVPNLLSSSGGQGFVKG